MIAEAEEAEKNLGSQGRRRTRKENSRTQVYEVCNVKNGRTPAGRGRIMPREKEEGEISDSRGIRKKIQGNIL